jgi:hypothetical protein
MFIGYYKSVTSSKEFYSEKRKDLNFPIQVEYKGDRYLLSKTIQVSSNSHENNIINTAKKYGIEYDIRIDSGASS